MSAFFCSGVIMEQYLYLYIAIVALIILTIIIFFIVRNKKSKINAQQSTSGDLPQKLAKTKQGLLGKLAEIVRLSSKIDEELMDDLEEVLLQADVGVKTSSEIMLKLREQIKNNQLKAASAIKTYLEEIIRELLLDDYAAKEDHFKLADSKPFIILFVGVNGVGKTTTIGKLAKRFTSQGKSVLLIAADTFRAAAIEQLTIWAERSHAGIVKQQQGADPSAVVYDGVMSAVNKKIDIVLIDTAGRQHTKVNLMNELSKIVRTIKKIVPEGPHETLLVVDSTTGQNALSQADLFDKATNLTGLVLTKLDGTAKGGIIIGIKHQLAIPVKLIGVGEAVEDLRDFDVNAFVDAIFE